MDENEQNQQKMETELDEIKTGVESLKQNGWKMKPLSRKLTDNLLTQSEGNETKIKDSL